MSRLKVFLMMRKIKQNWPYVILSSIIAIVIIAVVISISYYYEKFKNFKLSSNPSDWATFGDYMSGTVNTLLSVIAICVTIWLTINVSKYANSNIEKQINTDKNLAKAHVRNEALKELRVDLNNAYNVWLENLENGVKARECLNVLHDFRENYSYLFELDKIENYKRMMEALADAIGKTSKHIKSQKKEDWVEIVIAANEVDKNRRALIAELGKLLLS
jgi:hypothetical protein